MLRPAAGPYATSTLVIASLGRLISGSGPRRRAIVMSRKCNFEFRPGLFCDNIVADTADHCRAMHRVPPRARPMVKIRGHGERPVGLDLDELVAGCDPICLDGSSALVRRAAEASRAGRPARHVGIAKPGGAIVAEWKSARKLRASVAMSGGGSAVMVSSALPSGRGPDPMAECTVVVVGGRQGRGRRRGARQSGCRQGRAHGALHPGQP